MQIPQEDKKLPAALASFDVAIQLVAGKVVGGQQVPDPMRAGVGRPPPATRPPAATAARPLPAWVGLKVERTELVHADDHLRVAGFHIVGAVISPYRCKIRFFLASKSGSLDCFQVLIT